MKFSNVTDLVFGRNGEFMYENPIKTKIDEVDYEFDFGLTLDIKTSSDSLCLTEGSAIWKKFRLHTYSGHLGCQDYAFHSIMFDNSFYTAIVYHNEFNSIGYHLFYDWLKFFIPEKPRCGCCQGIFNKQLIYANKVKDTMVKYFKVEYVYGNEIINDDLRIVRKEW